MQKNNSFDNVEKRKNGERIVMRKIKVIKRDGKEVEFNEDKILNAILKANDATKNEFRIKEEQAKYVADSVSQTLFSYGRAIDVEEIQNMVELSLMKIGAYNLAQNYAHYRVKRGEARDDSRMISSIFTLVNGENEEMKQENANKDVRINSTQRDYIAGIVSKETTQKMYENLYKKLSKKGKEIIKYDDIHRIMEADDDAIIHVHDKDYFIQPMHNCDLINLEDMLQNGTVISGTTIDKPSRFYTAANITTQIIAQVASNQYGGQTFSLTALAPFVNLSRQRYIKEITQSFNEIGLDYDEEKIKTLAEKRVRKEISDGIQTIQYQLITLMTTNGQAPFVTMFMYLNSAKEGRERDDLALLIEEVLNQRLKGVKDDHGVWVTPAFPKLIFALDEDNVPKDSKYRYLYELAAKCSAKRMVPDYVSVKKLNELKGDVYPPMGCVDGKEVIDYKLFGRRYVESFERAWMRTGRYFEEKLQNNGIDKYRDLVNAEIWDNVEQAYVPMLRIIRNNNENWLDITFSNGRQLVCTPDHPFEVIDKGMVYAEDLTDKDRIYIDNGMYSESNISVNKDFAWTAGLILCDASYRDSIVLSLGLDETDIANAYIEKIERVFDVKVKTKEQTRGKKGHYLDLSLKTKDGTKLTNISDIFKVLFEGVTKLNRHIPSEVFDWEYEARLAFLAGMIDADGYINNNMKLNKVQIGSTNKELSIQQMLLAQSLGMRAVIYQNHYDKKHPEKIRYRVEFVPSDDLIANIVSVKKVAKANNNIRSNEFDFETCSLINKKEYKEKGYSYDVTTGSEHFTVSGIYSHNCRSFLTNDDGTANAGNKAKALNYVEGEHKYYGRFNQGVVTVNLAMIGLMANKDMDEFWNILDEYLELAHSALRFKHERLLGTKSDVAPILWQYGALARLAKGEKIDKLLYGNYSTISLGYAGIYEMTQAMLGKSHTTDEGRKFALAVMQRLNDKCKEWRDDENLSYSVYGTPMESTTYKFAKALQKEFGVIPEVSEYNYITNSYHINVREEISAFDKIEQESKFQELSPGGAISYVEVPNMQKNPDAVMDIIEAIYDNTIYAEINTKSDHCEECGYDGEMILVDDGYGKLVWECPSCGNRDDNTMNIVRRVCGYLGEASRGMNQGRLGEIHDRVLHVSNRID